MAPSCLKSTVQDGADCVMARGIDFGTRLGLLVPGERYNLYLNGLHSHQNSIPFLECGGTGDSHHAFAAIVTVKECVLLLIESVPVQARCT